MRSLSERISQIVKVAIIGGEVIGPLDLDGTYQEVRHNLGRTPDGVFIVKNDGILGLLRSKDFTSKTISLAVYTGQTATVSVWVF